MTVQVNQAKAEQVMSRYKAGEIRARKSRGRKFLSLEVSYFWRWLSKDGGNSWELLPHKEYEKIIDRLKH